MIISLRERGTNSNAQLTVSHQINIPYHNSPRHLIQISSYSFLSGFPCVLQEHTPEETHIEIGCTFYFFKHSPLFYFGGLLVLNTCQDEGTLGASIQRNVMSVPSFNLQITSCPSVQPVSVCACACVYSTAALSRIPRPPPPFIIDAI